MISITQGDSFAHDFTIEEYPDLSTWSGTWTVVAELGTSDPALGTGPLAHEPEDVAVMQIRITPFTSNALPVGGGYLVAEVTNYDGSIRMEIMQERVKIKPQGVPL